MKTKSEALSLPELIKKRNELMIQLKLGKSRDSGRLVKIRRDIARAKTESRKQKTKNRKQRTENREQ